MFQSVILDVVAAVSFTFLGVSLLAGAITEAIASFLDLRAATLRAGIAQLLNDTDFDGLAAQLYAHALIHPRGAGLAALPVRDDMSPPYTVRGVLGEPLPNAAAQRQRAALRKALRRHMPAYIDSRHFAAALSDVLGLTPEMTGAALPAAISAQVDAGRDPQIHALLTGMAIRSGNDFARLQMALAEWFDNAMDRLSGTYKRRAQLISFLVAFGISVAGNADAFAVAQRVWAQPVLLAGIGAPALDEGRPAFMQSLPLGWAGGRFGRVYAADGRELTLLPPARGSGEALLAALAAWLTSAVCALFGAPFWFDALQRVARLKGTGPSPAQAGRRPAG